MPTVTVVVPAFNEEKTITDTIRALKQRPEVNNILVVNDGSSDNTFALARQEGVEVLDLSSNRGKGAAMNSALEHINTDIIAFVDGDLGSAAGEVYKILAPVLEGKTDLCIAAFPAPTKKGGFGLVKGMAARAIRKAGNLESIAPLSGQRAMTREVLEAVTPFREGYGVELGMTIKALQKGFRIMEVPTTMTHNETGRDLKGFLHRGKQFVDVVRVIRQEGGK
jgi:glycosyltransferase involved in cell wall biosynthesis